MTKILRILKQETLLHFSVIPFGHIEGALILTNIYSIVINFVICRWWTINWRKTIKTLLYCKTVIESFCILTPGDSSKPSNCVYIAAVRLHHEGYLYNVYVVHCLASGTDWYCTTTRRSNEAVSVMFTMNVLCGAFCGLGPMSLTAIMNITASFIHHGASISMSYHP